MANKNDDLGLGDLGLDDINFDFDPVKGNGKPISRIATSFGKSLGSEMVGLSMVRRIATLALPTGYGKAINTLADVASASKKLYSTAATEMKPILPDVKRAVQKILPKADKVLPEKLRNKLDAMSKPAEESNAAPSEEDRQNSDIAESLGTIFATKMQYDAEQKSQDTAYTQVRNQIKDDQFRMNYGAMAVMSHGIQRLVAYQDQVTANYQRKSLELQFRQYFATREILRITALGTANTLSHLRGILYNTAQPDFAKSGELGKIENSLAQKLAKSMFPNAQKFMSSYFTNAAQGFEGKLQENIRGFIDAYSGAKDIGEMTEGMDRHTMLGQMLGGMAAEKVGGRFAGALGKRLKGSKLVQRYGNKLSYKLGNIPASLNNFAKDRTDHTDKHGALLGTLMNAVRDFMPVVGEGSAIVGKSSLLNADEAVSFNRATRQSLTEVIPGYLSRIHHELVIMRTGDASTPRMAWNPVKSSFTTSKVLSKDIYKNVYKKDEMDNVRRKSADFVNVIDKKGRLSKTARDAIHEKILTDAMAGKPFNPKEFMQELPNLDAKTATEVATHFRRQYHLDSRGATQKTSNYRALDEAMAAHASAVNSVPGIKERITALHEAGYADALHGAGLTSTNEEGDTVFDKDHFIKTMMGKNKGHSFNEPTWGGRGVLGGMASVASGGATAGPSAAIVDGLKDRVEEFSKSTDQLLEELRGGSIVMEERKQVETLAKILHVLETNPGGGGASGKHIDDLLRTSGEHLHSLKGRVVKMGTDGYAHVIDAAGKLRKVKIKDLAGQAKAKVTGAYQDFMEKHGDDLTAAQRSAKAAYLIGKRKARTQAQKLAEKAGTTYHEFVDEHGDLLNAAQRRAKVTYHIGKRKARAQAQKLAEKAGTTYHEFLNEHGDLIDAAKQKAKLTMAKAAGRGAQIRQGFSGAYHDYMDRPAEGFLDHTGHFIGAAGGLAGSTVALGGRAAWGVTKGLFGAAKLGAKGGWWTAKKTAQAGWGATKAVGRGAHWLFLNHIVDVYVPRQKEPVMYAKLMKMGRYVDAIDGKTVMTIKEIHGPVKDKESGQIVLTAEEYAHGLYNSMGQRILKGIGGGLLGITKWMAKLTIVTPIKLAAAIIKAPVKIFNAAKRFFTYDTDIYVGGEKVPRLYGTKMAQGQYVCETTGKDVHKASDIQGPVKDKISGQILLTKEDIDRGIYNALGHNLTRMIRGAWKLTTALAALPFKVAKFAWNVGTAAIKGVGSFIGGGISGLADRIHRGGSNAFDHKSANVTLLAQLDTQRAIFRILHERLAKPKKAKKSSWEEDFIDKSKKAEQEAKKGGMKVAGGGRFLGGIFSKKTKATEEGDGSSSGSSLWDKFKGAKNKLKGWKRLQELRKLKRMGKLGSEGLGELETLEKGSKVGKVAGWAKRGWNALRGGSKLARAGEVAGEVAEGAEVAGGAAEVAGGAATAAEAVAGAATAAEAGAGAVVGAEAVGGTLAAILSAPVLLAVGAVAALGLGAYLAWKWYQGRGPKDLIHVRLAQYGIDKDDTSHVKKVLGLESILAKHVSISGGSATVDTKGINPADLMKDFGVNMKHGPEVNAWVIWYRNRFLPVFLNTIRIIKSVDPKVELGDADKNLKPKDKLEVLNQLRKLPDSPYKVAFNPFAGQKKWLFFSDSKFSVGTHNVDTAFNDAFANVKKEVAKDKSSGKDSADKGKPKTGKEAAAAAAAEAAKKAAYDKKGFFGKAMSNIGDFLGAHAKPLVAVAKAVMGTLGLIASGTYKLISSLIPKAAAPRELSPLQAIRVKTYGLSDLAHDKVSALLTLEQKLIPQVTIDGKGNASYSGDLGTAYDLYCGLFGLVNTDAVMRSVWTDWFKARFLPTMLQYASAVYNISPSIRLAMADTALKPDQALNVGHAIIAAKAGKEYGGLSVWKVSAGPWHNYALGTSSRITDGNLEYLKQAVGKMTVAEKTGQPQTAATATAAAKAKSDAAAASKAKTKPGSAPPTPGTKPSKSTTTTVATATKSATVTPIRKGAKNMFGTISGLPGAGGGYGGSMQGNKDVGDSKKKYPSVDRTQAIKQLRMVMSSQGITDPNAQAALLANIQAESNFKPRDESLHYSAERLCQVFPSHFASVADAAACVAQGPEAVGNRIYGGRMGNGPDEGYLYRGRGYIQLTGKNEYARMSKLIGVDLVSNPDLANDPKVAAAISVAYIKDRMHGRNMSDVNAVTAAIGPANLAAQQAKRASLARSFLTGPGSTPPAGMPAANDAMMASVASKPHVPMAGSNQAPAPVIVKKYDPNAGSSQPMVPDIASSSGSAGMGNRIQTQQQRVAMASDDIARKDTQQGNEHLSNVADILSQSYQTLLSMDTSLKSILAVMSASAPAGTSAGPTTADASVPSKGPSTSVKPAPVDVSRKYG